MLSPSTVDTDYRSPLKLWQLGVGFAILAVLYVVGFALGGEIQQIMFAGLQTLPFMVLALLAYLGLTHDWAKVLTLLWLFGLVALTGLMSLGLSLLVLTGPQLLNPEAVPDVSTSTGLQLAVLFAGSLAAVGIGALGFIPAVRVALSRWLPFDPRSFVHMVALVGVVAITLMSFVPLLALASPPLLEVIDLMEASGQSLDAGGDANAQLRATVYGLVWLVPGTIVAVGYGVRRDLRSALQRLGLVRPTLVQVLLGIVLAVALVALVQGLGLAIEWLWQTMGWPQTDAEAFSELLAFAFSPLGAVVIGITAGLGEELAVRGVLQPRLGILLSNLFFTALHAFQYNWDSLLIVFTIGIILGLIRNRTNTTTSAIVHGVYDFILVMLTVYQVPGFTE